MIVPTHQARAICSSRAVVENGGTRTRCKKCFCAVKEVGFECQRRGESPIEHWISSRYGVGDGITFFAVSVSGVYGKNRLQNLKRAERRHPGRPFGCNETPTFQHKVQKRVLAGEGNITITAVKIWQQDDHVLLYKLCARKGFEVTPYGHDMPVAFENSLNPAVQQRGAGRQDQY